MKKTSLIITICLLMSSSLFSQDLKPKKDKETKKYGFVNKAEEWIVKPIYDDADKFKDGFAKIYLSKKEGLITETGAVLVEPQFDDIEKFKDEIAIVKLNKKYGFIDKTGKTLCEPKYNDIDKFTSDNIAKTKLGNKYGLIKNDGSILIEPRFNLIEKFYGNLANVSIDVFTNQKRWGLIDKTGKVIFEPIYAFPLSFNSRSLSIANIIDGGEGIYLIVKNDGSILLNDLLYAYMDNANCFIKQKNSKWVVYDANTKPISKEFDEFGYAPNGGFNDNGMICAREGNKWGFIDLTGNTIIPFNFDQISQRGFHENFCAVKIGEKWGYIDRKGKYLKEPMFEEADMFVKIGGDYVASVKMGGKEYVLYANTGELKLKATPANNVASQSATTSTTQTSTTTSNTQTTTSSTSATADVNNDWIIGTWKITEEKMGGAPKTGNNTTSVSYLFNQNGSGSYVERYDVMANKTTTSNISWSLSGNKLTLKSLTYTLTVSTDKRSMTMAGPMGTYWKLSK